MTLAKIENKENSSPFDSIKRIDEEGNEYWSARDLLFILGYARWAEFLRAIERAETSCKTLEGSSIHHFRQLTNMVKLPQGGSKRSLDYCLSRYACYLVAMNGDPKKSEVASAQSYFAIKTREAEAVVPQQLDRIRELELQVLLASAERDKALAEQKVLDTRQYIVSVLPEAAQQKILGYKVVELPPEKIPETVLVDEYGKVKAIHSGIGITALAAKYGFGKGTKANNQCRAWMKSVGIYDEHWDNELVAQYTPKLPRDLLPILDRAFQRNEGVRQLYIGE